MQQLLRRDFLVGAGAGLAATRLMGWALRDRGQFPRGVNPSFAQSGEDVIVKHLLDDMGIKHPSYLDIGAFLPIAFNNTCLFYGRGGRGVLVEPNIDLIPELEAERPGDTVLNVGIGLTDQRAADYYCMTLLQWNTFSPDEARKMVQDTGGQVRIERVVPMPLVPINRVIAAHFGGGAPDFLSIDVESLDLAILQTLDFSRFRPKVICTETLVRSTDRMRTDITEFLTQQGYEKRAVTIANSIYVDRQKS